MPGTFCCLSGLDHPTLVSADSTSGQIRFSTAWSLAYTRLHVHAWRCITLKDIEIQVSALKSCVINQTHNSALLHTHTHTVDCTWNRCSYQQTESEAYIHFD